MQDTPQPTDQQREEFREFLSEVIATLRTAQELTRRIPTPEYFDGEGMAYADPIIAEQKARIDTTVRMLDELRGDFSREWLHAYMERKRANAKQPEKFTLILNLSYHGKSKSAEVRNARGELLVKVNLADGYATFADIEQALQDQSAHEQTDDFLAFFRQRQLFGARLVNKS